MDVVNLINHIQGKFGSLFRSTWGADITATISGDLYEPLYLCVVAFIAILLTTGVFLTRKWHKKVLIEKESLMQPSTTRFRKRDKALFYGRKMLRKVRSISGQVRNSGQGRKRKMVMRFARRLLQLKKENETEQLKVFEPPAEYLQETTRTGDDRMPADVLYILQSIRVFGHFEKPIFLKLCKHTEIMNIEAGTYLFKIGEPDENVFVVQSGKLNVYITNPDGTVLSLKVVKPGESVTSLLSFTDILSGHLNPYKTVSAKAIENSTVIKLPMIAFQEVFQDNPDVFIRVIQVIMVRLQRVTFTALHDYLGLSAELVNPGPKSKRNSFAFASPSKKMKKEEQDNASDATVTSSLATSFSQTVMPIISSMTKKKSILHEPTKSLQFKAGTSSYHRSNHVAPDMIPDNDVIKNSYLVEEAPKRKSTINQEYADDAAALTAAYQAFVNALSLDSDVILHGKVDLKDIPSGTYLVRESSISETTKEHRFFEKDIALVYVLSGALILTQSITDSDEEVHMYTAYPGEFVGGLAILTGEPSFFTIRAKGLTRIALISNSKFYMLMKERPNIVLHVANIVVRRLSAFVRQVDFALDWVFLEAGRAVYRQEEESDSTFVVLSGRLRSVITHKNGKKEIVGEYGKGDLIGIVEMVTQTRRSTTVIAVRDSELAKLPEGLFNIIKLRFPIVVTRLIKLLGRRILGSWQNPTVGLSLNVSSRNNAAVESRPAQLNFSTVAIVPVSDDVPLTAFTYELYHCLSNIGLTLRLTSEVVRKSLGLSIMDPNNEYRLTSWLAQQEDHHKISLYQCDTSFTAWTQRCIRQADCILIVGLGGNQPTLGKVEKEIERVAMRTQKELVLLHREANGKPKNTVGWLNQRTWISSHHHILCPKRMFSRKSLYRINELYLKVCMSEPNIHSDFSRLARWLTGKSVGLVLGGGGARGAAHVGMIKSIIEAGIPIDMVGGVSIGAFMGALWCKEKNITTVTQMAREWAKKMTQWWRQILDLTYPMTSMFSGRDFNQTIHGTFGDTYIEDLWLPYFTVTTDISASCMRIHQYGSLWRYVRSSMSLSGYMPPLCDPTDGHLLLDGGYTNNLPGQLWKYIRASMSIVGIFPPMCDPVDGHMLSDGCYVNNVPADVMRSLGANHIIAIDVGSVDDSDLTNYGDDLSGWWLLWKRWNPFTESVKVPNLPDIQSRLAYVSCVRQLEEVKTSDYCEYIRPPIDCYRTLQFGSFDEIRDVGYRHGKEYFGDKLKAGTLPTFRNIDSKKSVHPHQQNLASYTFTDLAQMVCKVQGPYEDDSNSELSSDDDNDNRGYASEPSVGISEPTAKQYGRPYGSQSFSETEMDSDVYDDVKFTKSNVNT